MKILYKLSILLTALALLVCFTACDENDGIYDEYKGVENALVFEITDLRDGVATVEMMVCGEVKLCGMQGSFTLPDGVSYVSHTEYAGFSANHKDGTVYFVMAADQGENLTVKSMLLRIELSLADAFAVGNLGFTLSDIYDRDFNTVSYTVYGGNINLEEALADLGMSMEDFRK